MPPRPTTLILLLLSLLLLRGGSPPADSARLLPPAARLSQAASQPLAFEPNAGQADPGAPYLAHVPGGVLLFAADGITLQGRNAECGMRSKGINAQFAPAADPSCSGAASQNPKSKIQNLHVGFVGADPAVTLSGGAALPGRVNYLRGNDPAQWRTGLPTYSALTYHGLYPGVDLLYNGQSGQLKGTYSVAPGADPARIRWVYEGAAVRVDSAGNLLIERAGASPLTEAAPVAWQEIGGRQIAVAARYDLAADGSVGFALGSYSPELPLILDPALIYSTYLGGALDDEAWGIAVDGAGNAYLTGTTISTDFPTVNPYQGTNAGSGDAFVVKLTAAGVPVYSTYLGGSGDDAGWAIAVNGAGQAYVTGGTASTNFPTANAYQPTKAGGYDAFLLKLAADGSALIYATYLGGTGTDEGYGIAVDGLDRATLVGYTLSANFPMQSAYQGTNGGGQDIFVTRFNAAGAGLIYSTYLGGSGTDTSNGIALDSAANAYLTGQTNSPNFPIQGAYQPTNGGASDAFLTRLNNGGATLGYSTYLGSSGDDYALAVGADAAGDAVVTGGTDSPLFPRVNAYQSIYGGGLSDAWVARFPPGGSAPVFSTFLGSTGEDVGTGIALDGSGDPVVSGYTGSLTFPLQGPFQPMFGGGLYDGFVSAFWPNGSGLIYSTYLGGNDDDITNAAALDSTGNVSLAGQTFSTNFPTAVPYQGSNAGGEDAFVARLNPQLTPTATPTLPSSATATATDTLTPSPTPTITPSGTPASTTTVTPTATPTAPPGTGTPTPTPPPTLTRTPVFSATPGATATPTFVTCPMPFNDVDPFNPFYHYVRCLYCQGIAGGYPCGGPGEPCPGQYFRPYANVTRGQVSKIVSNSAGFRETPTAQTFEDAPPGSTFYLYIERLASRGYVSGYPCGGPGEPCVGPANRPYFRPNNSLTRGQLAKIAANAAGFSDTPTAQTFADVPVTDPFWIYIERLGGRGIVSGYDCGLGERNPCTGQIEACDLQQRPYFRPCALITRGQTSKIVSNTFFPISCAPGRPLLRR